MLWIAGAYTGKEWLQREFATRQEAIAWAQSIAPRGGWYVFERIV